MKCHSYYIIIIIKLFCQYDTHEVDVKKGQKSFHW